MNNVLENVRITLLDVSSNFKSSFYDDCVEYISSTDTINEFNKSHMLNNKYIIESFRLYFYRQFSKFHFYIIDYDINSNSSINYNKLNLSSVMNSIITHQIILPSDKARLNLLRQLDVIENDDIYRFTKNLPQYLSEFNNILFLVSSIDLELLKPNILKNLNYLKLKNRRSLNLFLHTYSLSFLKHQDLDRFTYYLTDTNKYVMRSVDMFKNICDIFKQIENIDISLYERLMLFSGFVLHTLGTTYTSDADVIYDARGLSDINTDNVMNILKKSNDIDYFLYMDEDPDIDYISNIITDPNKHYYFLGMKLINIKKQLKRLYYRARPTAFVDLIMLHKINGYNIKPCIPIMNVNPEME